MRDFLRYLPCARVLSMLNEIEIITEHSKTMKKSTMMPIKPRSQSQEYFHGKSFFPSVCRDPNDDWFDELCNLLSSEFNGVAFTSDLVKYAFA